MQTEVQRIWESLRLIYGSSLVAGTVTLLVQTEPTKQVFKSFIFPQETEKT
jgi:hypothetical protein